MDKKKYEKRVDHLIEQISKKIKQNPDHQIKNNIIANVLKEDESYLSASEKKEVTSHLHRYMQKKVGERKETRFVRISKGSDGRYAFYTTKTTATRQPRQSSKTNEVEIDENNSVYLNFESNSNHEPPKEDKQQKKNKVNVNLDLQKLRKKTPKMETVHFRVDAETKQKLDNWCEREGIQVSELLRNILNEIL